MINPQFLVPWKCGLDVRTAVLPGFCPLSISPLSACGMSLRVTCGRPDLFCDSTEIHFVALLVDACSSWSLEPRLCPERENSTEAQLEDKMCSNYEPSRLLVYWHRLDGSVGSAVDQLCTQKQILSREDVCIKRTDAIISTSILCYYVVLLLSYEPEHTNIQFDEMSQLHPNSA
jgi:hypothetical protein